MTVATLAALAEAVLDSQDMRTRFRDALIPWMLPVLLAAAWEIAERIGWISARILPAPSAVALAFWVNLHNGELIHHSLISMRRALTGLAIGGGIGFVLGVLNGTLPSAEKFTDSLLRTLRNVPHLAIIPLVTLWFGGDESAKIILVAIGVLFPIYLNTFDGIRMVDRRLIEMGRVCGLSMAEIYVQIVLPGALPSMLAALRRALGVMWLTLIVAETISPRAGIGYMTMNALEFLQTDVVVLDIIVYALLGKFTDVVIRWLERRALACQPQALAIPA